MPSHRLNQALSIRFFLDILVVAVLCGCAVPTPTPMTPHGIVTLGAEKQPAVVAGKKRGFFIVIGIHRMPQVDSLPPLISADPLRHIYIQAPDPASSVTGEIESGSIFGNGGMGF